MEDINWKEKVKEILAGRNDIHWVHNTIQHVNVDMIVNKMIEFAKLACEEQKKICAENALLEIDNIVEPSNGQDYLIDEGHHYCETFININQNSIINSPTVKFD